MAKLAENGGGLTNQAVADITRNQLRISAASVKPAASVNIAIPAPNAIQQADAIRPPTSTQQIHPTAYFSRKPAAIPCPTNGEKSTNV